MRAERWVIWLFRANALINWVLAARTIMDPQGMALVFGGPPPNYLFLVRLWGGLVFMFGCMFWEVSRDVGGKAALIKYNWIEKTITATAITLGYVLGDIPQRLMLLIIFTNWLWIPFIVWADMAVGRVATASRPTSGSSGAR